MKYQIKVEGKLNSHWKHWFEGMAIDYDGDTTIITGPVPDQSALHGLFHKIRDLNLTLLSVSKLGYEREDKTNKEDR